MNIRARSILLYAMGVGLLFPSGLGIDLGVILNSSKVSLLMILSLMLMMISRSNREGFKPNYVDRLILNFIVCILVGSVISGSLNAISITSAFTFLIASISWVLSYFSFYFVGRLFSNSLRSVRVILRGVLSILFICALFGIVEAIFRTNIFSEISRILGLYDAGSGEELWRGNFYRVRSSLDHPLPFGFAMVCAYVLTNYLVRIRCTTQGGVLKLVFITSTFLSGSRSAILVLLVCLFVINYRSIGRWGKWLVALVFVSSLFWLLRNLDSIFYADESYLAGEDTAVGQSGNLIGRVQDFDFVLNVLEKTPLFGIGTGMLHDLNALFLYYPSLSISYDGALDNMVFAILVENGIFGLLMALIAIIGTALYAYHLTNSSEKQFLILLIFIFVAASLSYDILVFPGTARLMFLLISLGISNLHNDKPTASRLL